MKDDVITVAETTIIIPGIAVATAGVTTSATIVSPTAADQQTTGVAATGRKEELFCKKMSQNNKHQYQSHQRNKCKYISYDL